MKTFRCTGCGVLNRVAAAPSKTPICGRCKKRLDLSGAPQDVSGPELESVVASAPVPVLVDFWAPWCGPCRMAAPLVERAAKKHAGELIVLKLNSDENTASSARHGISGIPAFVLFSEGREVGRQVGLPGAAAFDAWVAQAKAKV